MSLFNAILQGIIQGLSEFLPISSSGHLSIFQYFTGQGGEEGLFFTIVLHLGTLAAVFIAFYKTIADLIVEFFRLIGELFTGRFTTRNMRPQRKMLLLLMLSLTPLLIAFFFRDFFEGFSTDDDIIAEGVFLMITGILLLLADKYGTGSRKAASMTPRDALAMGIAQAIAPLPGISRSGSTVAAGLLCGLDRQYAVAFSFIMGLPAVLGANLLSVPDALASELTIGTLPLIAGLVTSLIFGLLAIRLVKLVINTDKFRYFAYYTLAAGFLVTAVGISEIFTNHAVQRMLSGG